MIKVLAVVALLAVAQIIPSCGGSRSASDDETGIGGKPAVVIGWVDEKRFRNWEFFPYMVVINGQEYGVPKEFWAKVDVGDLIKYDGETWTIVRKRR